jgi:hypothetical protein
MRLRLREENTFDAKVLSSSLLLPSTRLCNGTGPSSLLDGVIQVKSPAIREALYLVIPTRILRYIAPLQQVAGQ